MSDTDPTPVERRDEAPHVVIAALLYMMSRYRRVPCPRTHAAIVSHLQMVAVDGRFDDLLRQAAQRLHREWAAQTDIGHAQADMSSPGAGAVVAPGSTRLH